MITLFAALSAGAKTYLRCNFSIFFFNDLTERLGGCLYKCGCLVKLSILMSMTRKNSFFQSLRACTPTQVPNGTGSGFRRSKRPLLASESRLLARLFFQSGRFARLFAPYGNLHVFDGLKADFLLVFFFKVDFLLVFFRPMGIYMYFGVLKWTFCPSFFFLKRSFCSFGSRSQNGLFARFVRQN